MPIRILPDTLASQIAAGEVVERPASALKELIENSIDAGADAIAIDIRGGGRELIQVADNGAGIPADQIATAFQRHATSKIEQVEDLAAIGTLGFRGEALAAIAAVGQVTMVTRTAGEDAGMRFVVHGGKLISQENVGAPLGTVIAVENLFYNVPARLKFLKSAASEKRVINDFVSNYALAYPDIRFRLTHDGRISFQSPGNGAMRDTLSAVFGAETARALLEVHGSTEPSDEATLRGYVSPPSLHRANRGQIILFVNGRWVKDNRLTYAVAQAYHTLLPAGRFPIAVLFIALPFDQVDVNVHPAKTEVRFRQPGRMFSLVQKRTRQTLLATAPVRGFTQLAPASAPEWGGSLHRPDFARQSDFSFQPPAPAPTNWEEMPAGEANNGDAAPRSFLGGEKLPMMRVVGQIGASYIVTEGPDGLFMIDQHAAHERILYERFLEAQSEQGMPTQGLVTATTLHLTPGQAGLLTEQLPALTKLGFNIEPFGRNAFVARGVPSILAGQEPKQAVMNVVEELENGATPLQEKIEALIIKRVCKTAAVKAGQTLSLPEMQQMIQQLEGCANPHTCPHGRPTLIHLSMTQLAREFGRI